MSAPEISVIVPVRDEVQSLPALVSELLAVLSGLGRAFEVLLVDDGSTDGSREQAQRLAAAHPPVRALALPSPAGQSPALLAGIHAARGALLVTLDADLQNDPADIPRLLAALADADAACGVRARRQDPWSRRAAGALANAVRRAVLGDPFRDSGCSLKAFPREAARRLPRFDGVHRFLATLLLWQGLRIVEVEVAHRPRRHGRSKYGIGGRALRGLRDLVAMRRERARLQGAGERP